ncbi:MAG: RNA polymerase sigma factor [Candidatus Krumholzibacteriota bacterium]|nr:RNA polymerase sigma factor [Candidatus Krumholzibacteriota bacterium]
MNARDQATDISRETLVAWKAGGVEAFERIVRSTMKRAYATAVGLLGNAEDAKDVSQEAFMAAHRARERFDPNKPFYPWFYRILRNRCLNFIEKRARRRETSMEHLVERRGDGPFPDTDLLRRERCETVWRALFSLSADHREIIVLRSFQELTYREIAATLGISEGTVMSRLFYARRALAAALRRDAGDESAEGDDPA